MLEKDLLMFDEFVIQKQIIVFGAPLLLAIGTIGNLISFYILLKNTRKASTYTYLSVLAIMDILVIYVGLLRVWLVQLGIHVEELNSVMCKLVKFLGFFCSDVSVWLIVIVTVERTIVVALPLKAPSVCNSKYAKLGITSVICIFVLLNLHFLWSMDLHYTVKNTTVTTECKAIEGYTYLVEIIWPWVDAAFYSFIPFVIIFVLNIVIIKNVINAKNARLVLRQQCSLSRPHAVKTQTHEHGEMSRRITCMLLAVSFTFLITVLPMNILIIRNSLVDNTETLKGLIRQRLLMTVAEMLMYTNHSINFFLYCATGKKFRGQFRALACSCCRNPLGLRLRRNMSQRSFNGSMPLVKINSSRTDYVNCEHFFDKGVQL
ncbi:probable G-protein coupled receptor 139 [Dreissena polymorpha]|uniref:G-protein coupled receptors family 1 profile domain-containing protein n=1 Tax=Dreissena polymorpha TaxID=45954 RepID=A0A9D4EHB4_DREPO|nr:probable G-protein coupled receptor 139 [Dreissena polymorpha]KAH3779204.1 hypothetical protein DPMN_180686 [Dreissena polymorpha]